MTHKPSLRKWVRNLRLFHERPINHFGFTRARGQGVRLMIALGPYSMQIYVGGVRVMK